MEILLTLEHFSLVVIILSYTAILVIANWLDNRPKQITHFLYKLLIRLRVVDKPPKYFHALD